MSEELLLPPRADEVGQLEVRLLGTTEVRRGGEPVVVGGLKQRGTLALLALAGGRPVAVADLVAGLWGDDPPPSAVSTLRAYLSRLRTGVTGDLLRRASGGYWLDLSASVDAVRFEAMATAAHDDVEALGAALSLWRGPALEDLRALPFAGPVVARLEELHAGVRDLRCELLIRFGRAVEVLDELKSLVAAAPHDERLAVLLMRALARTGRHAEALTVFETLRVHLAGDLGLDPGPEARELHAAVLVHDPAVVGSPREDGTSVLAGSRPVEGAGSPELPGNLPLPLSTFVGRTTEVAALHDLLASSRLVTLTGPGGCGKTRLAVETAKRLPTRDMDGPWLVELAGLEDGSLVPTAVAQTLGVIATTTSTLDAIVEVLHGRRSLLLLDNCEHLIDEVATFVERFLTTCPGSRVLATSREPLRVLGERVHRVASLSIGSDKALGDAEQLFADRARSVLPGFHLDAQTVPLVRRLALALDGMPLALELAAARLNVITLDALADGLDDRFVLLTEGSRTALPRHRTLAAAIGWSHGLLGPEERAVFASASVFRGFFELRDLAAVHDGSAVELVPLVGALVNKSMVAADPNPMGTRRYRLLETLRIFGQERLGETERRRLADAHAAWFTERAEDAASQLRSFDDGPAFRWLDGAQPDLRAALNHALGSESQLGPRLFAALGWYWYRRGFLREGLQWASRAAPLLDDTEPDIRAHVLREQVVLRFVAGDAVGLLADVERLEPAAEASGDATIRLLGQVYSGYAHVMLGNLKVAEERLASALTLAASGEPADWARAELALPRGQCLRASGRPDEAVKVLRKGREIAAACGHRWAAGTLAWIEAKARLDLGDVAGAAAVLAPVFAAFVAQGDRTSTLTAAHTWAAIAAGLERHADGARLLGAVDALGERVGYSVSRMEPVDSERNRQRVAEGLTPEELTAAYEQGRGFSLEEVAALIRTLSFEPFRSGGGRLHGPTVHTPSQTTAAVSSPRTRNRTTGVVRATRGR